MRKLLADDYVQYVRSIKDTDLKFVVVEISGLLHCTLHRAEYILRGIRPDLNSEITRMMSSKKTVEQRDVELEREAKRSEQ